GGGARRRPAPPPQDALRLDPGRHLGTLTGDGDLVPSGRVVDPLVDDAGRREPEQPEQERGPGGVPLVARLDRRRRPPRRAAEAGEEESQAGATEEGPPAAHPDLASRRVPPSAKRWPGASSTHPRGPTPVTDGWSARHLRGSGRPRAPEPGRLSRRRGGPRARRRRGAGGS